MNELSVYCTARTEFTCKAQWSLYVDASFNIQQFYVMHTVYLCVLCGSENKQRLFPYTELTDWFL